MSTARVSVFGSANMDLVVYADRLPQQGETVTGKRFVTVPGGKGANQAIAAARAGASVAMVGAVGLDSYGDEVLDVLSTSGVDVSGFVRCAAERTGTAHIVVDADGDNRIIVVPGANGSLVGVPGNLASALDNADALLLQLELPIEAVVAAAELAHANGVKVVLTPAPVRPLPAELLAHVDLLVPNEHESAAILADTGAGDLTELVPEAVVTLGSRGATWLTRESAPQLVPAHNVPVRDTTAAGDTFAGALSVALCEGRPMLEAMHWATTAAALSVQRDGASPSMPTRAEIGAGPLLPPH